MPQGRAYGVATQEPLATQVGRDMLAQGGNAVDAAIAVASTLAVTLPEAGNLGGGGFMLIYIKKHDKVYALDYREKAPIAAWKTMFVNQNNIVNKQLSRHSLWASGVPGTVAGLHKAWKNFGSLSWKECLAPAIQYAEKGFPVPTRLHNNLKKAQLDFLERNKHPLPFFPENNAIQVGETLIQPELAQSLKWIAEDGPKAFYNGPISERISAFMKQEKGLITSDDFIQYEAIFRDPVSGSYHDYTIYSMPPPSSGGIHLLQMLQMMEPLPLKKWGYQHPNGIQAMTEAMNLVYQDRAKYLGDPDFVSIPQADLLNPSRNLTLSNSIQSIIKQSKRPSPNNKPPAITQHESHDTTHFSIIDAEGNMVSNTYTLNFRFGNKRMVPGTGILLNNEMDDFAAAPNIANAYGLVGSEANSIQPEKRMLSSMTPTLVFKDNAPWLATGSPGGSRIITIVFQTLINMMDYDMNLVEASHAPRIHHQWVPKHLYVEEGIAPNSLDTLVQKGYSLKANPTIGSIQSVLRINEVTFSVSDPRTTPQ